MPVYFGAPLQIDHAATVGWARITADTQRGAGGDAQTRRQTCLAMEEHSHEGHNALLGGVTAPLSVTPHPRGWCLAPCRNSNSRQWQPASGEIGWLSDCDPRPGPTTLERVRIPHGQAAVQVAHDQPLLCNATCRVTLTAVGAGRIRETNPKRYNPPSFSVEREIVP